MMVLGALMCVPTSMWGQCVPASVSSGDSTGSSYYVPVNNYYNYSLSEMIFDADELGGPMVIDTIGFYLGSMNPMTRATDVRIYMKYTQRDGFASTTDYEVVDETAVLVYSGALNCAHGWNDFALTTPFHYDGDGNVMVIVHDAATGYDGSSYKFATSSTGSEYKMLVRYSDSSNPLPGSSVFGGSSGRYQYRPVMRMKGCEASAPACRRVSGLTVDTVTESSVALSWNDSLNTGAAYSVYMVRGGEDSLLASGFTQTVYTVTGLEANSEYHFGVKAVCGVDEETVASMVVVRTLCGVLSVLPMEWGFEEEELQGSSNALRLPWCMERYASGMGSYTYYPYSSSSSSYAHSGSRYLYFYPGGGASYPDTQAVVLPQVDVTAYPMDGNRLTFWARMNGASSSTVVYVGTLANPADLSTFTLVDTVQVAGNVHRRCVVPLTTSPATNAYVAVVVLRTGNSGYLAIDDLRLEQLPSCGDIEHLAVDSVSSVSVSLSWDSVPGATYTLYDMSDGSVVATGLTESHYTVSGLQPLTEYTFGVRSVCVGGEGVMATLAVTTACGASGLPFTEDFEAGGTFSCWTLAQAAASTGVSTSHPYSGSRSFRFSYNSNPPQYLISPELEGTGDGVVVEFSYANYNDNYSESFAVGYSTTGKSTEAFTWLPELTNVRTGGEFLRYSEVLPVAGIKYLAIKYTANDQYYLYVDSVVVKELPSCLPVAELSVDSVTATSVLLSWNNGGNSGATYTVYMDTVAVATGLSDTVYEVTDLEPATPYTFSVVAECGAGEESAPATVSAMTDCGTGTCQLTFQCSDYYADGWNGAYISVMQSGVERGTVACQLSNETYGVVVCSGVPVDLMWHRGEYDDEATFTMTDGGGATVFSCTTEQANLFPTVSPFFTLATPCPECLVPIVTVDSVGADEVSVSWTVGNALGYNIYINDTIVEALNVTDNHYTITGLAPATGYVIGVEAICSATDTSMKGTVLAVTECGGGTCEIVISTGSYGLLAASIDVMQNGALVENFYGAEFGAAVYTASVCGGTPISFVYHQTPYAEMGYAGMISFTISNGGGAQIYECATATNLMDGETFLTVDEACPQCGTPQAELVEVTQSAATIRWNSLGGTYDLYLDSVLVQAGVADTFYTFTGLAAATDYLFGVMAVCSASDSSTLSTLAFRTPCAAISTLPYAESFDVDLGCWTTVNNSNDGYPWMWEPSESGMASHSGEGMAISVSYYYPDAVHADAWLISPQISLPSTTNDSLIMSWWYRVDSEYPDDRYEVRISTTSNSVDSFTTQLADVTPNLLNGDWSQMAINLTPYAGQSVYVAFHHYNSYDADFLAIDDVEIYEGIYQEPQPDSLLVVFEVNDSTMGTTVPAPGTYRYGAADTIFFGSYAIAGNRFNHWEITYIDNDTSESETLDASYANGYYMPAMYLMTLDTVIFKAYFEVGRPDSTTITYAVNNPSMGTTVPAPGTYTIYVGDSVTAVASAHAGYELAFWTLATYRSGSLVVRDTMAADNPAFFGIVPQAFADYGATITVTAYFQVSTVQQHTVTLQTADGTMGSVVPVGNSAVNEGASFTATAYPSTGFHFVAWMCGNEVASEANPYTFTVTEDVVLTATFASNDPGVTYYDVMVSSADEHMGTVSSSVPTGQVAEGSEMTVSAIPAEGYRFRHWSTDGGAVVSTDNPYTFTVDANIHLFAIFEAIEPQAIEDVSGADVIVYSTDSKIIVKGAENLDVYVYDVNGRVVRTQAAAASVEFTMNTTGLYLVKVGNAPPVRVVVVR